MAGLLGSTGAGLRRPAFLLGTAFVAFLLTGCAVQQRPLAEEALLGHAEETFVDLDAGQPSVDAPLSLAEAISRALKYNLELRGRLLEQSLAAGELKEGNFDMLPKLVADAGYSWRSNQLSRLSSSNLDPDNAVFSVAREHADGDLAFQWNVLDFGASYYTARQNGDRLLIANERRRKATHTLIQNVRTAYWRAYAAQLLNERVEEAISQAEAALRDADRASSERVRDPVAALRYQRTLLENLRLLEAVQQELSTGRVELSQYIGRKPGEPLHLSVDRLPNPTALLISLEAMEVTALARNADLRESAYDARIAALEARKALIGLLPGISFNYGYNFDDDRYLVNDEWYSAGTRVSYNLLTLISAPERMRNAKKRSEIKEAQRRALEMAVVTQVHLARHQYDEARKQYERAQAIYEIDKELAELYRDRAAAEMVSRMDRISADVTFILSTARLYQALSRSQEAASRIEATLGLEPAIDSLGEQTLEQIQAAVESHLDSWANEGSTSRDSSDERAVSAG
jgi:outer membrane protein TolC